MKLRKKLTKAGAFSAHGFPVYKRGDEISVEEFERLPDSGKILFTDVQIDDSKASDDQDIVKGKPTAKDGKEAIMKWLDARKVTYDAELDVPALMKIVKGVQG